MNQKIIKFVQKYYILIIVSIVIVLKIMLSIDFTMGASFDQIDNSSSDEISSKSVENSGENTNEKENTGKKIYVDIEGAVVNPGLYEIDEESRIGDVVELAGGFKEANESCLNLAEKVIDEELLTIPKKNEKCVKVDESLSQNNSEKNENESNISMEEQKSDKVNINTATAEELQTLNGVGETRAQDIIDYREINGDFTDPADIQNVSGIGEATYAKMEDQIEV